MSAQRQHPQTTVPLPVGRAGPRELVLPWPVRALHPNARVHWAVRHKHAKQARLWGELTAKAAQWHWVAWPDGRLHVWITAYPPSRRRYDADGVLSSLKPWLDGIADAMGVDDARFVPHPFVHDQVRKGGEVRVRVTAGPGV